MRLDVQDEEFIGRFRSAPADAQARMLHGLQSFGVGLLEGVTGAEPLSQQCSTRL